MKTRHSFNVNCAMPGDVGKLIRVLEAWQPPALFCMNSLNASDPNNIVIQLRNVMAQWGGIVIFREYEGVEAALWKARSVDAHLDKLARYDAPWVWFNVGNEPVPDTPDEMKRMADWYAEMVRKAPARGLRVVLPGGFASGTFSRAELPNFDAMWQAMGEQRHLKADGWNVVVLGTHEYGHVDPRYHVDNDNIYDLMTPATARAHRFKTQADIFDGDPSDNWLILRTENMLDRMAQVCGVPRTQLHIDVALTECIWDRMPNIETQHRALADALDALNGEKTYGWPKVRRALEALYGKPAAEVGADIFEWMEAVYPDNYRVFCHFSWTEHNDHPHYWRDRYGLGAAEDLHAAWTARIPKLGEQPPVTTPETVPKPADAGAGVRVRNTSDSYRVRSGPGTNYVQVGGIAGNVEVTIFPATKRAGGTYQWVWVEGGSGQPGWVADEGQFAPVAPVFGAPTVQRDVPFQTQRSTGVNNCGEAALTALLNYWLETTGRTGQVMMEDIVAAVNNAGAYATLAQLRTAAAELGLQLDALTNLNLTMLRAELDAGRPFIALVERGKLPGTQAYYAFTGAHYVVVTGYGDGFVTVHDPLSLPGGAGVHLKVGDDDFLAAWDTTSGNSGHFQALVAPASQWTPAEPGGEDDVNPDVYAAVVAQTAKLEQANAALVEALQAHTLAVAEVIESLRGIVGYMP